MSIPKIEEILKKKPEEIVFFEDSNSIIELIASLSTNLEALPGANHHKRVLYRAIETHYRALAAIDGIKDTFKKMADYFAGEARKIE